jgi:hypothetical protein
MAHRSFAQKQGDAASASTVHTPFVTHWGFAEGDPAVKALGNSIFPLSFFAFKTADLMGVYLQRPTKRVRLSH